MFACRFERQNGQKDRRRSISRGHLYWILSNPIYVGRLRHKGQIHDGLHPAIVDVEIWDRVQHRLASKRSRGGRPSPTIIPFLWVSSMTIAETGWAPAMRPRADGVGATMCHARRCRDASKRPDRSCAFRRRDREPGCQRSLGSSRGAGKRDRRLSHRPRRRTWRLRDRAVATSGTCGRCDSRRSRLRAPGDEPSRVGNPVFDLRGGMRTTDPASCVRPVSAARDT